MTIRKYYFLMLLGMAAKMFVVNEVRASMPNIQNIVPDRCKYLGFILNWENPINLVGGALFHLSQRRYNFYKNKTSFYFDWWCGGWNSKPFAKGHIQFCPNINLGRGLFWIIVYYTQEKLFIIGPLKDKVKTDPVFGFVDIDESTPAILARILAKKDLLEMKNQAKKQAAKLKNPYFFPKENDIIINNIKEFLKKKSDEIGKKIDRITLYIRLLQDLVSLPLIIHFRSKFSISISIDSIIWMVVTHFVDKSYSLKARIKATERIYK